MVELKPCPFCGGDAIGKDNSVWEKVYDEGGAVVDMDISEADVCWVECKECGAIASACETEDEAADAWNRRANDG